MLRPFLPVLLLCCMLSSLAGAYSLSPLLRRGISPRHVRLLCAKTEVTPSKKASAADSSSGKYSKTVFLPTTSFEQRANAVTKEPKIQQWWSENRIYDRVLDGNSGDVFVLHDGPPYANGDLHIGHAMNKILKDFINRYQLLRGKKARFVPGWDCHGLPIELKVLQSMKQAEREQLTPLQLRRQAAAFAVKTMETQKQSFQRYGVWADWSKPYLTLDPSYEAAQIRVFGQMVTRGHIYRGKKPVHWSPSSRTALAEAELEYPDNHFSRSIYVAFPIVTQSPKLQSIVAAGTPVSLAIWTTTPWTIPANLAVAVNGDLDYCLLSLPTQPQHQLVVAKGLVETVVRKLMGENTAGVVISESFKGSELVGCTYQHPLYDRTSPVLIGGDYITTESGTGLVHTAPGHGVEDYQTGLKNNLPLLSPVDDRGCFTAEAGERFAGLDVLSAGNEAVIQALNGTGTLLLEEKYHHKYPYDWRTKKPTIFRATEQWFASVSSFRDDALKAIDSVTWIPYMGRNRIAAMTQSRGDWCISRQRSWGVPIPVFYHKETREPLMTPETLAFIEQVVATHGSDAWWEKPVAELLPPGPLRDAAAQYEKGADTMDVWFDSGTSWAGVVQARAGELTFPADIYLEGSDQSRGWFQSSLLTAVASQGSAPYKTVLTHGFVLDEKGLKMSKSLGNVIDPSVIINGGKDQNKQPGFGADTLRLWVAGVDYSGDVSIGNNIIKQVAESYRKVRITLRYLLGSLSDFVPQQDAVDYAKLADVDKYMLGRLTALVQSVEKSYETYNFYKITQDVLQFVTVDLSAFYLELAKDRLYISGKKDWRKRSCQTVLHQMLHQLTILLAPILPHIAEEVWQHLPYEKTTLSVFEQGWIAPGQSFPEFQVEKWDFLRKVRNDLNKCIELARQAKQAGASTSVYAYLYTDNPELQKTLQALEGDREILPHSQSTNNVDDLRFLFIVSQVTVCSSLQDFNQSAKEPFVVPASQAESGLHVGVAPPTGKKCERCWLYCDGVGKHAHYDDLCQRCAHVVESEQPRE